MDQVGIGSVNEAVLPVTSFNFVGVGRELFSNIYKLIL